VPAVRDFLDRFRPAGAPGAATAAGVPVDRLDTAAAELAPVFAALAAVVDEGARLRGEAVAAGLRLEAETADRCRALVAAARGEAEAERAAEAAKVRERAATEARLVVARAQQEAEEVRRTADEHRPRLLAAVLDRVRVELMPMAERRARERGRQ
jgi:hypothetical protein